MSFFGKILQSVVDVAVTPVEVVKDCATMGGLLTDQKEAYTVQRIRKLAKHLDESYDELGEL